MIIRMAASTVLAALFMSSGAWAASADYLLKIEGVPGESKAQGQIEIMSYSWGATNTAGRTTAVQPPTGPGTVTVTTAGEAACAKGKHFPKATLSAKTGSYTLEDVTVTACNVHGDPHVQEMSYGKVSYSDLSVMSGPKKGTAPAPSPAPGATNLNSSRSN